MRRFSSYGPVDPEEHYCVARQELVGHCVEQLVGHPDKGGHFFTIWAPRQAGKTWVMRRAIERIREKCGDRFVVAAISMQGVMSDQDSDAVFFRAFPGVFREGFGRHIPPVSDWSAWLDQFDKDNGLLERPTILIVDEFDSLPREVIDRIVGLFRKMYLARERYHLHGLALIGVRAVLGIESERGSPFNIQRSLHVPNLTEAEVHEMFDQYRVDSGQEVDTDVPAAVFDATRGQPGLVSWFGELLTEKYNPAGRVGRAGADTSGHLEASGAGPRRPISDDGPSQPPTTTSGGPGPLPLITLETWRRVYTAALHVEWNNTVLNLIKKARGVYQPYVLKLFSRSNLEFSLRKDWCNHLYLNGIIDYETVESETGRTGHFCRFSSPFIQQSLYDALTDDLFGDGSPVLALEPGDLLNDVFSSAGLNLPPLLDRYKSYLERLKDKGLDPWKGHPRRETDAHLTEAVGHFHLYAWLKEAIGRRCLVSPEFPTGNGKVDLLIRGARHFGIIEVKSFVDSHDLLQSYAQTARYARQLGLDCATLAVFMPVEDKEILERTSGERLEDGVRVVTVAIGWT